MTRRYVLDAWALLALLQREEPAASRVKQLLRDAPDTDTERFISISCADAFAAAAAEELAAILVTGDPELAQLKSYIQIEMLERIA